jgi:hypothetical protein
MKQNLHLKAEYTFFYAAYFEVELFTSFLLENDGLNIYHFRYEKFFFYRLSNSL